ncbi:MAG: universal stress protein [Hyphomicrobiales bacterium]|nr:universal stress protein [Hyphomicrobiales bacterium]
MIRLAYFIDGLDVQRASIEAAVRVADHADMFLDVHHPWASPKTLAGRPEWRPVNPDNVAGSGRSQARTLFQEVAGERENTRFIGVDGHLVDAIRSLGVAYDIVMMDRLGQESGRKAYAFNAALFETGAPVLVLPPGPPPSMGDRAVVIWTGTRQSGRALRAAIPFLTKTREVLVLSNLANPLANPVVAIDYLHLHGVEAQSRLFDGAGLTARGRGRAVIKAAVEHDADLMVMGAFGYNGLQRILDLGRTTQKMVTAAPIPLLVQS